MTKSGTAAQGVARRAKEAKEKARAFWSARTKGFRIAVLSLGVLFVTPPLAIELLSWFLSFPSALLEPNEESVRVVDRTGHLLREVRSSDGSKGARVGLDEARAIGDLIIAVEDARFRSHHGVDWRAVVRASFSNLSRGHVVSGASTITMQLARTVSPGGRSFFGKIREAALARVIERRLSKDEILLEYVNRVSFGPNLRGAAAASQAYFDKPLGKLSLGEAALIAGIVRGPSYYDLVKHGDRAIQRRTRVLAAYEAVGGNHEAAVRARSEPLALQHTRSAFGAPHFVRAVLAEKFEKFEKGKPSSKMLTTTLDANVQRAVEASAQHVVESLREKHVTAASVLVLDNATGEVLAYVGAPNFFDEGALGQNDGVFAKRQPGSTLKPFLYELGVERLGWTPATVLPDVELHVPVHGVDFSPKNYDQAFHGPVLLRTALGSSLNVPAVFAIREIGAPLFLERLHALGFDSLTESADFYGPSLALGDGEVTLLELTRAYATLARGGAAVTVHAIKNAPKVSGSVSGGGVPGGGEESETRPMNESAAARIIDVLKDKSARYASFGERNVLEFSFEVAAKTGTSKGYRDNWAVGFSSEVTVGAWVGNFDGSAMDQVSGISGAGPLFHQAMEAAMSGRTPEALPITRGSVDYERVDVCALSGKRATADCHERHFEWFTHAEAGNLASCDVHQRIRLDRRNGLRAATIGTEHCPASETIEKVFEIFPSEYESWAKTAGRNAPPSEWSPDCPAPPDAKVGTHALRIDYPSDGGSFVLDPDRPIELQELSIAASGGSSGQMGSLFVDGQKVVESKRPLSFPWRLSAGKHVFVVRSGTEESAPVHVEVR